ncbi:MAG: sulfotransferase, partial [bacterium]
MNKFKDLQYVCLIIGANRSGSSLLRAIIDAHPNAMIAHELGRNDIYEDIYSSNIKKEEVFYKWYQNALNKRPVSQRLIYDKKTGKIKKSIYNNTIENSSQGNCDTLKVIGDKSGPWIAKKINDDLKFVKKLDSFFGITVKYINIVRNPLDNIMSMKLAHHDYKKYFYWCNGPLEISKNVNPNNYMDLYLEELIDYPVDSL